MTELTLSRRMLLKAGVAGVSCVTLGGSLLLPSGRSRAGEAGEYVSLRTGRVLHGKPTTCALCPAGCGVLAFSNEQGEPEGLAGNPRHPVNQGALCAQGSAAMNLFNSPYRVQTPVRRVGDRGAGSWEPVSWDRALSELGEALQRNLTAGGRRGSVAVSVPERRLTGFLQRFVSFFPAGCLEAADGYELQVERDAHRGLPGPGCSLVPDLENADIVLNFGANPLGSVRHLLGAARGWAQGTRGGARWITLDPRLSETASASRRWIPIRPGTDGAFASAVAGLILQSGREDRSFLQGLPTGEEARMRDVLGRWSPELAARICGVSPGTIRDVAEEFAGAKSPVAIFGSGVTARQNGERDARGVLLINYLTGNVDRKGGCRLVDDLPWKQPKPGLPRPAGPLLPGTLFRELELGRQSLDMLITFDANPAATDPDGSRTVDVLKSRERVPFHVALASSWNETVHLADLVLPAATYLEEWGLSRGVRPSDGSCWVGLRQPVFRPEGEARPGESVLLEGVRRLGERGRAAFPFPDMGRFYREVLTANAPASGTVPAIDSLRGQGFVLLPGPSCSAAGETSGSFLNDRPSSAASALSMVVPPEAFPGEAGPATAGPGAGGDEHVSGNGASGGPGGYEKKLLLYGSPMQGPDASRLMWVEEIEHNRPLWMHPAAAREVGCSEGDWVRVRGPAGEIRTRVRITEGLHPEAVAMSSAAAGMLEPDPVPGQFRSSHGPDPDRVWWSREIYGENVRKVVPWPTDPDRTCPGWEDTRVTIIKTGAKV